MMVQRGLTAGVRAGTGLAGAVLLLATACSGGGDDGGGGTTVGGKNEPNAPQVTITPGNGNGKAKPEEGVQVKVANGALEQVTVTRKGKPVEGQLSPDKTSWKSRTLRPNSDYEVSVVAKNPQGKTTAATSKFKTLKPAAELTIADITPTKGEKVGVGMPIIVTFNRGVDDRKAVEQALGVKSTKPAVGAWYWASDSQVIFRTKNGSYWKPNQKVTFTAKLAGIKAGKKTYGVSDVSRSFRIGNEHITTVSTKTKKATFKVNGKVVKRSGVSAGKGGRVRNGVDTYLTTSGVHLTMSKHLVERMTSAWMGVTDKKDPEYYDLKLPHAVRISSTGEYLHASPDRYWAFGRTNASHGCVNLPPPVAQWFYNLSYRGDPVIVTGSKRGLDPFNGWSFYAMSWNRWVKGSALDRTVTTG
ncbi:L,D-transpeptidase [Actinomadura rudentiformis]|nr:Ig-like domain-containing protein [Actinomadura rudentiformis]